MKRSSFFTIGLLFIIFSFAFYLRTIHLDAIPPGLNRDEVSIGYTAYSLLKTGKDEYGVSWPISFKSFGDWKLPLYIYLTLPFINLFGLTEFAVRFPSALLGSITVLLVYFLVYEIFKDKNAVHTKITALLSSVLFAISPWSIFMSRNASESNVTVFLVVLGLLAFFKSKQCSIFLLPSFFLLSLTLYTYHGNHIFTPLLFVGIIVFYYKKLLQNRWFFPALFIFIFFSGLIYSKTLLIADKTKIGGLFPLGDVAQVHENIELQREPYKNNEAIGKLIHNKGTYLTHTIVQNYIKGFSPEFLFITGGYNAQHTIPMFGNLYIWQALAIPAALYFLLKGNNQHKHLLLFWFFISPIAASITRDAPHTNRMMGILPLPSILSAFGLISIIVCLNRKKLRYLFAFFAAIVIVGNLAVYIDRYYVQFPRNSKKVWDRGYKQLVQKLSTYQDKYDEIIISRPYESPYIYYLFYTQYDPLQYQRNVVRYPETEEGFQHVQKLDNITFSKINWENAILVPNKLYIDWAEGVPNEATQSSSTITLDDISNLRKSGEDTNELYPDRVVSSNLIDTVNISNKPQLYLIETVSNK